MTLSQVERRLAALEKQLGQLQDTLEYERAVAGIRRGLQSADREEGESVKKTFSNIRRKHALGKRQ